MKKQLGFSLMEFTIAMGVTLTVLAATMLAFKDATRVNQNVTQREDVADNIRAGMNLIQADLIQAATGIPTGGITIPSFGPNAACPGGYNNLNRPNLGVGGNPGSGTKFPPCNLTIPSVEPGNALGPFITSPDATSTVNTDIITILYADNTLGLDNAPIAASVSTATPNGCSGSISAAADSATFDVSHKGCVQQLNQDVQVNAGDLIMFSNTNGNALAVVTSVAWPQVSFGAGDFFGLNQSAATLGTLKSIQNKDGNGNPNGVYPTTTATRIWMITYYLDNLTDPAHVRLVREVNANKGYAVGETLENLQFTYNYNDGKTANQPSIPAGYSESQIRSVNLYLGARSVNKDASTNQYVRSNFQTLVSLRSMAYVNKYQ